MNLRRVLTIAVTVAIIACWCHLWAFGQVRVDVWHGSGCPPCKQYAPVVKQLQDAGHPVLWIDIAAYPRQARDWKIRMVPTTLFTVRNREVKRLVGPRTYAEVVRIIGELRKEKHHGQR